MKNEAIYQTKRRVVGMREEKKYRKRLSLKFTIGFLILGIFVITSSCIVGYLRYTAVIERMYNENAYHIADTAMEYIDGDLIEEYVDRIHDADEASLPQVSEAIRTEEDYQQLLSTLSIMRDKMGANYLYIADQTDGKGNVTTMLTYLFDADNPKDDFPPFVPGDTGTMNEEFLTDSQYIYETGKRSDNYFYSHSDFGYNTSAIEPIKNSDGEVVAIIGVELAMETLQAARIQYISHVVALGVILTAFIIAVFMIYLRRSVIDPVRIITEEADAFVHNETEISQKLPEISTGDEIEQMANSILQMELDIRHYIDDLTRVTAERERIGAELNVATKIQADMLPSIFPPFPDRQEFDLYASMTPAKEVGGDFYDFFMVDDDHLALVMADVSGKGVPAALFMVISKTLLKNHAQNGLSAREILETVNNKLCENNQAEMFVTVWIGLLEISTGVMRCANAGHEYPAICKRGGSYELLKDKHGFVLGGMEHVHQHEYEVQLAPGDRVFLYTDGVVEATDASEELYGSDRMVAALNTAAGETPEKTLAAVQRDVDAFVGDAPQFDDLTMLCLHYRGTEESVDGVTEMTGESETALLDAPIAELTLDATLENLAQVMAFAEQNMEALDVPMKAQMQINIAVDEIFSNIANYAYGTEIGQVTVQMCTLQKTERAEDQNASEPDNTGAIILTFIDRGVPYDPLAKEDPDTTLSLEEREIGGLGIFMVKKSMDEMTYEYKDGQNILRIRKNY